MLVLIAEEEGKATRFEEAVPLLRGAPLVQQQLKSKEAIPTADSLCRALLGLGQARKDRAKLLEARELCRTAIEGFRAAGDEKTAKESQGNLDRVETALAAIGQ